MKAFRRFISKYLRTTVGVVFLLVLINGAVFAAVFSFSVASDYGASSPVHMLALIAEDLDESGLSENSEELLTENRIWAMLLDADGRSRWEQDVPDHVPRQFTVPEAAAFSRSYLADYPVFTRAVENGLLVLGYPKNSFMKITGNYLPMHAVQLFPLFVTAMLAADTVLILLLLRCTKRSIAAKMDPIMASIDALAAGKWTEPSADDELAGLAQSVARASQVLEKQNEARANWISGVSHDIRTPLSLILGYAQQMVSNSRPDSDVHRAASLIRTQSLRIRDLVQDLNLTSQLEYDMQPVHLEHVRLSTLLRTCAADLLNAELDQRYSLSVTVAPECEKVTLAGDSRLLARAVNNLIQNSIQHNTEGCCIGLCLDARDRDVQIVVEDDGLGLPRVREETWMSTQGAMESTDAELKLKHGLGLQLVAKIMQAHQGSLTIRRGEKGGCRAVLTLPRPEESGG